MDVCRARSDIPLGLFARGARARTGSFGCSRGASASGATLGAIGTTLAASFSYIMSWSPYASDYSRYLSEKTSKTKVVAYALLGGAVASFAIEALGAIVGNLTGSLDYFVALRNFSAVWGV